MQTFQVWLVAAIEGRTFIAEVMQTGRTWAVAESLHFLGLCLLVGAIGTFDLRLLGLAKRVPITAVHRLIPWGLLGFGINIATGALFVMTEPDQYIYNSAFHLKLLFITIAGLNAGTFYLMYYPRISRSPAAALEAPKLAKAIAAISLCAWIAVITCGRLITFYRPFPCSGQETTVLLICTP
jgi:hypothetical protein